MEASLRDMEASFVKIQHGERKMRATSVANFAVAMIVLFCLLPALVQVVPALIGKPGWRKYLDAQPLYTIATKAPPLRLGWWDRALQTTFTAAVNERLPLRNFLVRLNNQLDYWILRASRMYFGAIVVGKRGVLFEMNYIAEAFGYAPTMSDAAILREAENIKRLRELLARRGIPLIAIGTPGKVSFRRDAVPAYFPEYRRGTPSNYDRLVRIFAEQGVPFVDGRAEMRASNLISRGPFFPIGGTHWTLLGAYAAVTGAVSRLVREADPSSGAEVVLERVSDTSGGWDSDLDLLSLINLLFPPRYESIVPQFGLKGRPLRKAITLVGSSFSGQIVALLTSSGIVPKVMYFAYMQQFWPCWNCKPEQVPPSWPAIILDESAAVIIEINEAAFFFSYSHGNDYIATLVDGIRPLLERPPSDQHSTGTPTHP